MLDRLRAAHPHVLVEGCAGGGARVEHATIARTDVVWPSDNTGPLDRLAIQYGFPHAPQLMSSWVTDAPGLFDPRPRSLRFRFVTAMAGALGIGADIRAWTPEQRAEAADWIARYKELREVLHHGEVQLLGRPDDVTRGVQYTPPASWCWRGTPGRSTAPRCSPDARYVDATTRAAYGGAHLPHAGLPLAWTSEHDAEVVILDQAPKIRN